MIDHILNLIAAIGGCFAIAGYLAQRRRPVETVAAAQTPASPVYAPAVAPHHEILRRGDDGEWQPISQHPHAEGIAEEMKEALRTPGMAVRWHHGAIEEGRE